SAPTDVPAGPPAAQVATAVGSPTGTTTRASVSVTTLGTASPATPPSQSKPAAAWATTGAPSSASHPSTPAAAHAIRATQVRTVPLTTAASQQPASSRYNGGAATPRVRHSMTLAEGGRPLSGARWRRRG